MRCHSNRMDVQLEFDEPFNGVIFADQAYNDSACRWEGENARKINFSIPILGPNSTYVCGITLKQETGEVTCMLIVSPMKNILVDGVTSLQIRCLYSVNDITITMAGLKLVGLEEQTGIVTGNGGVPTLQIRILDGHGITGNTVTHASIGQQLTLDIILEDTEIYDFYAHSCLAHDGSNNVDALVQIIDANGCGIALPRAIELPVYTTTHINGNAKHVYIYMYGFQFTTSQFVYFECQARPCIHSCRRHQCEAINNTSSTNATTKSLMRNRREAHVKVVKLLTVLEMRPPARMYAEQFHSNSNSKFSTDAEVSCPPIFLLIVLFTGLGLMPSITVAVCYVIIAQRRRQQTLDVQRTLSFSGIHNEEVYSSSSDN
uniref:ZP domain-containing protein n=1 Tax=Setaria digitata TaxID=48799 RepID=A0A915PDU9_9BILA